MSRERTSGKLREIRVPTSERGKYENSKGGGEERPLGLIKIFRTLLTLITSRRDTWRSPFSFVKYEKNATRGRAREEEGGGGETETLVIHILEREFPKNAGKRFIARCWLEEILQTVKYYAINICVELAAFAVQSGM